MFRPSGPRGCWYPRRHRHANPPTVDRQSIRSQRRATWHPRLSQLWQAAQVCHYATSLARMALYYQAHSNPVSHGTWQIRVCATLRHKPRHALCPELHWYTPHSQPCCNVCMAVPKAWRRPSSTSQRSTQASWRAPSSLSAGLSANSRRRSATMTSAQKPSSLSEIRAWKVIQDKKRSCTFTVTGRPSILSLTMRVCAHRSQWHTLLIVKTWPPLSLMRTSYGLTLTMIWPRMIKILDPPVGVRTLHVLHVLYTHNDSTPQVFVLNIHSHHLPFTTIV